jgi:hypothetical protein
MEFLNVNIAIANQTINMLAQKKCTVAQSAEILSYRNKTIAKNATV